MSVLFNIVMNQILHQHEEVRPTTTAVARLNKLCCDNVFSVVCGVDMFVLECKPYHFDH